MSATGTLTVLPGGGAGNRAGMRVSIFDLLDKWFVDYATDPGECCFVKHVARKGVLYQLVAGCSPAADGLYQVSRYEVGRGADGRIRLKLKEFESVIVGQSKRIMRRKLVELDLVTPEEFDRYFSCAWPDKEGLIGEHAPIRMVI